MPFTHCRDMVKYTSSFLHSEKNFIGHLTYAKHWPQHTYTHKKTKQIKTRSSKCFSWLKWRQNSNLNPSVKTDSVLLKCLRNGSLGESVLKYCSQLPHPNTHTEDRPTSEVLKLWGRHYLMRHGFPVQSGSKRNGASRHSMLPAARWYIRKWSVSGTL